jgi:hypothetical protein
MVLNRCVFIAAQAERAQFLERTLDEGGLAMANTMLILVRIHSL